MAQQPRRPASVGRQPGHRRRGRRAVRRPPARPFSTRSRPRTTATAWCSKSRSISAKRRCAPSRWTPPKAWSAARKSPTPARRSACRSARRRSAASSTSSASRSTKPARSRPKAARHPPGSAELRRPVDRSADPRHRHQGRRPARALRQGRQDRPVRRRRRRQDRADPGTDQQRRQGARRLLGVRRRRRAHPRGQRPLSRVHRVRRQQADPHENNGSDRGSPSAPWCSAR